MHPYNDDVALQNARDKELEEYLMQKTDEEELEEEKLMEEEEADRIVEEIKNNYY